jgi:type 1 glutamine amidotransferase
MSFPRTALALSLVLSLASSAPAEAPLKLLLIGQGPDGEHPPTTHEYMAGLKVLDKCLAPMKGIEVTTVRADDPWKEGPELIGRSDGVVLFAAEGARWIAADPKRQEALAKLAARGGALAVLHWGMGTKDAKPIDDFVKLFGGCHGGPDRKYKELQTEVEPAEPKHPVLAGVAKFRVKDELYYELKFAKPEGSVKPLLRATIDGKGQTVAWAWERPDGGRSFGFSGLHFHENWKLVEYRRLVTQGVLWTVKKPVPKDGLPVEVKEEDLKLKEK